MRVSRKNLNIRTIKCNYLTPSGVHTVHVNKAGWQFPRTRQIIPEMSAKTTVKHWVQAQLQLLFDANSVHRSIFNCRDGPHDILHTSIRCSPLPFLLFPQARRPMPRGRHRGLPKCGGNDSTQLSSLAQPQAAPVKCLVAATETAA